MEKCTLESLYELIIDYYTKGYTMDFNTEFLGTPPYKPRMLSMIRNSDMYCIGWDDDLDNDSGEWQHDIAIYKDSTGVVTYS